MIGKITGRHWLRRAMGLALVVGLSASGMQVLAQSSDTSQPSRLRHRGFGPRGFGGPLHAELRRLDLSDTQREQIHGVLEQHKAEFQALAERAAPVRQALRQAMNAVPVDEPAIREQSAALAAIQADMAVMQARVRAEVLQFLTPEQQQKLQELRGRMKQRFEGRRQWFE
jgi:Spy/CpxP family protein refolding chaperone